MGFSDGIFPVLFLRSTSDRQEKALTKRTQWSSVRIKRLGQLATQPNKRTQTVHRRQELRKFMKIAKSAIEKSEKRYGLPLRRTTTLKRKSRFSSRIAFRAVSAAGRTFLASVATPSGLRYTCSARRDRTEIPPRSGKTFYVFQKHLCRIRFVRRDHSIGFDPQLT